MRELLLLAVIVAAAGAAFAEDAKVKGIESGSEMQNYLKANVKALGAALTGTGMIKMLSGDSFSAPIQVGNKAGEIDLRVVDGELGLSIEGMISGQRVSGICENGIVTCDYGTWNNCEYYEITPSGLKKATVNDLVSCYCVSEKACNFKWDEYWLKWALDKFTRMVGNEKESFVDVISFPTASRSFTSINDTATFTTADVLTADTSLVENNETIKQLSENPLFSKKSIYECTIRNYFNTLGSNTINTVLAFEDGTPASVSCSSLDTTANPAYRLCSLTPTSGDCSLSWNYYLQGNVIAHWYIPDDPRVYLAVGSTVLVNKSQHTDDTTSDEGTKNFYVKNLDRVNFYLANLGSCNGKPEGYLKVYLKEIPRISVTHTDTCGSSYSDCRLKEEYICPVPPSTVLPDINSSNYKTYGCYRTVYNFMPQAVTLPSRKCWTYKTSNFGNTWYVCEDGATITAEDTVLGTTYTLTSQTAPAGWTYIKRYYVCPENKTIDLTEIEQRTREIESGTSLDNGNVTFSGKAYCLENKAGQWTCYANGKTYPTQSLCEANCNSNISAQVDETPPYPVCKIGNSTGAWVCKVQVSGSSNIRVNEGDVNNVDLTFGDNGTYEYRACQPKVVGDNVTFYCPVSGNETILEDCKCDTSEEALNAITIIQMLDNASKDIICSSSPP
ncbi:hypothetical protein [Desulfurobacterium sp.]